MERSRSLSRVNQRLTHLIPEYVNLRPPCLARLAADTTCEAIHALRVNATANWNHGIAFQPQFFIIGHQTLRNSHILYPNPQKFYWGFYQLKTSLLLSDNIELCTGVST